MKYRYNFLILISMVTLLIFSSCDQSEHQVKAQPDTTTPLSNRSDIEDCEDCPVDNCCCAVELVEGTANLLFCGIYTATSGTPCGPFNPASPCSSISGSSSTIALGGTNPTRELFCVSTGGSFRLENIGGDVSIRITCQYDDVSPDWEDIELDEDDVLYYDSNVGCFLTECN